jgi:hypothetical protein
MPNSIVKQAILEAKIEDLTRRIERQELINQGVLIVLILAIAIWGLRLALPNLTAVNTSEKTPPLNKDLSVSSPFKGDVSFSVTEFEQRR